MALPELEEIKTQLRVILARLEALERRPTSTQPDSEWITSSELAALLGVRDLKTIYRRIKHGTFTKTAVKNISTDTDPVYRFHRKEAVRQFLEGGRTRGRSAA